MNHRPFCAGLAGAILVLALAYGSPFAGSPAGSPAGSRPERLPAPSSPATRVPDAGGPVSPSPLGVGALADPDAVGECPTAGLPPVARRGRDRDGFATWWHADGSVTKRRVRLENGEPVAFVVRVPAPAEAAAAANEPSVAPGAGPATIPAAMPVSRR